MVGDRDTDAGPSQSANNSSVSVRRKRTPRVTSGQVDALLAFLEARPYLHTRKFTGLQGRENFETGWKEVAKELNKLPNASIKSPEQWITVWRDLTNFYNTNKFWVFPDLNPRQSVAEQHSAARREFQAVAQANADTLRALGAAAQTQADAAKLQAEALKTLADASQLFVQAANKIADVFAKFVNKNN